MATRSEMLAEAYSRGLLPPAQKAAYEEAQRRGLVGAKTNSLGTGILRQADAFMRGAADAMTFGFADEIAGTLNSFLPGQGGVKENIGQQRQRDRLDQKEAPVARFAGQVGGSMAAPGATGAARYVGAGATGGAKIARAAATGGAFGAAYGLGSGDTGQQRVQNALTGLATGAALGGGLQGASNALSSAGRAVKAPSPQRQLSRQNVTLTPGQMIGGVAQRLEDAATSVPFVGDPIRRARIRGIDSMNVEVANRTLAPLNMSLPKNVRAGRDAVKYVDDAIGKAYDTALSPVTVTRDATFDQAIAAVKQGLTPNAAQEIDSVIANTIDPNFAGAVNGKQLKALDFELGQLAQDYLRQGGVGRYTGQAILKLQDALDDALGRADPAALAAKNSADEAYANLVRLQGAAASSGARGGQFTASQLNQSVRRADPGKRKARFARGEAMLQDLSDPAMEVLPSTVPDSGTPFRAITAAGVGGGAVALDPAVLTTALTAIGATNAIYSRPALAALNALYRATDNQAASAALSQFAALAARHPELQPIYAQLLGQGRDQGGAGQQMTPTGSPN